MNWLERSILWFKNHKHPCYIGCGEFDHDLECVDESFDHEFGCEQILYMACITCGATHEEDADIPENPYDYYGPMDDEI